MSMTLLKLFYWLYWNIINKVHILSKNDKITQWIINNMNFHARIPCINMDILIMHIIMYLLLLEYWICCSISLWGPPHSCLDTYPCPIDHEWQGNAGQSVYKGQTAGQSRVCSSCRHASAADILCQRIQAPPLTVKNNENNCFI